jgi:hypothetical protein
MVEGLDITITTPIIRKKFEGNGHIISSIIPKHSLTAPAAGTTYIYYIVVSATGGALYE